MWLTSSSIGRKVIMAVSGAFLFLFVTFHALMNGVALFWPTAYNEVCLMLGANWYALIGTVIIAAFVVLHIVYASWLTIQNRKARGVERYAETSRPKQVEWSSKNMYVLGVVILAFLVIHLIQFWSKMQLAEILHCDVVDANTQETVPAAAGTWFLEIAFRNPLTLVVYLIGFIALWFHLTHGFWSMMQTVGWNNRIWMERIKTIGNVWVTCVVALFIAQAIVFTVHAHRGTYTSCPALIEQYQEMAAEGNHISIQEAAPCLNAECTETPCGRKACSGAPCKNAPCAQGECTNPDCNNPECPAAVAEVESEEQVIVNE